MEKSPLECEQLALGVISVYYPDNSKVIRDTILCMRKVGCNVFIVFNGGEDFLIDKICKGINNVHIFDNREKNSLSIGFNRAIEYARELRYKKIIIFDQDSRPNEELIQGLLYANTIQPGAGIIGPTIVDENTRNRQRLTTLGRSSMKISGNKNWPEGEYIESTFLINSGSVLNLSAIPVELRYDEFLSLDHVDSEFCLQLWTLGLPVLVCSNLRLTHTIGVRSVKRFLGITFFPNNHHADRRERIAFGGIYLMRKYPFRGNQYLQSLRLLHEMFTVLWFENDKISKLVAIGRGIIKGFLVSFKNEDSRR